jgi:8-oxo-dGTP pyrophosphatase MutT (NUDIX family)
MHRQNLKNLLKNYHPTDQAEKISKEKMLTFLDENPDCFKRTLQIGHITASAWLLNHDRSQALLMHHAKLNVWVQLGGHCDGESDALAVAIKEAQEESGIQNIVPVNSEIFDIDIHLIPENSREKAHYHYDVRFLLQVVGDQNFIQNRESKELRWIGKDRSELPTQAQSVVRMFDKWVKCYS